MSLFNTAHTTSTRNISDGIFLDCLELRELRDSILRVLLSVLAVIWEDTASIGNILGLCI